MSDYDDTSYTLLGRVLNLDDQKAWNELYEVYGEFIRCILIAMQVNAADIDDLSQQVFVKLTQNLDRYDTSKGRFRAWLKTVIRNTAISHIRKQSSNSRKIQALQDNIVVNGQSMDTNAVDAYIDAEWRKHLYNLALKRVEQSIGGRSMEVYHLRMQGVPAKEVAAQTGLAYYSVQTFYSRVKKAVLEEGKLLIQQYEEVQIPRDGGQ